MPVSNTAMVTYLQGDIANYDAGPFFASLQAADQKKVIATIWGLWRLFGIPAPDTTVEFQYTGAIAAHIAAWQASGQELTVSFNAAVESAVQAAVAADGVAKHQDAETDSAKALAEFRRARAADVKDLANKRVDNTALVGAQKLHTDALTADVKAQTQDRAATESLHKAQKLKVEAETADIKDATRKRVDESDLVEAREKKLEAEAEKLKESSPTQEAADRPQVGIGSIRDTMGG